MNIKGFLIIAFFCFQNLCFAQTVTLNSLLKEMSDRDRLAMFPFPEYNSLQASSYNRESKLRDAPGWFADSDGTGYIRTEHINGREEWVVMEHNGPGAVTKIWSPDFYYGGLDDMIGPNINIYLDGNKAPVISENYFKLITGRGSIPSPFARPTARAGNSYLPIPFAKNCKITFDKKPFYHIINYRSFAEGTRVQTFTMEVLRSNLPELDKTSALLNKVYTNTSKFHLTKNKKLEPGTDLTMETTKGGAVKEIRILLDPEEIKAKPELLRSIVLSCTFDNEETIWSPLGDFFGSANAINPFQTWTRTVNSNGQLICSWVMPFTTNAKFSLKNKGNSSVQIQEFSVGISDWKWDSRSMYFHTSWRPDDILKGSVFLDWNFIDIKGKGVIVGDAWTVLNPDYGWWGEGDEKIYVDHEYEKGFPGNFGTGTEDYYGWAGGENPSKDDIFSQPYLSNITVGTATLSRRNVRGFNICTRLRGLDAIPFKSRLVFDMEASPGVDIRSPWDFLGYSSIVFWYGAPGAKSNITPNIPAVQRPIMNLKVMDSLSAVAKSVHNGISGAIEFQNLKATYSSLDISGSLHPISDTTLTKGFNLNNYFSISAVVPGQWVAFRLTEQFRPAAFELQLAQSSDFSAIELYLNDEKVDVKVPDNTTKDLKLLKVNIPKTRPINNEFTLKIKFKERPQNINRSSYKTGLDYIKILY